MAGVEVEEVSSTAVILKVLVLVRVRETVMIMLRMAAAATKTNSLTWRLRMISGESGLSFLVVSDGAITREVAFKLTFQPFPGSNYLG